MFNQLFSSSVNVIVNGINLILFAYGLVTLLRAFYYVQRSNTELDRFKRLMPPSEHLTEVALRAQIAEGNFSKDGIIGKTIDKLFRLSSTSMDDRDKVYYLEEILNDQRTAIPQAIPNMAILIGFLGTVVGLLIAVTALPSMIGLDYSNSNALDNLIVVMKNALSGMGTAFGTTLIGLVVALVLIFGNMRYRVFWSQYEHRLTDFLFLELFPPFIRPSQENIMTALVKSIDQINSSMDVIKTGNQLLVRSIDQLSTNVGEANEANKELVGRMSHAIGGFLDSQESNKALFESIHTITSQAEDSFKRIQDLLDESVTDRETFMAYVQDSRNDIKETNRKHREEMAQDSRQHREAIEVASQTGQQHQQAMLSKFSGKLDDTRTVFMDALTVIIGDLKHTIETENQSRSNNVMEFVNQFKKSMKEVFDSGSDKFAHRVSETNNLLIEGLEKANESFTQTLNERKDSYTEQVNAVNQSFLEKVGQLQKALDGFEKRIKDTKKYEESETRKLIGQLSGLIQQNNERHNYYFGK